jgi:hypothetical protein
LPPLRRGAGFGNRCTTKQYGRQERARHNRPSYLLHQDDEIQAEPAAALLFRVDDPQLALPGELLPELVADGRRLGHPLPHELRVALALEKPPRRVAQQLLLLGEPDVHVSTFRETEDALADDVALDFAGAAGDHVLPRAEHSVVPTRGVGHC